MSEGSHIAPSAMGIKPRQTFTTISPNLIHKPEVRNYNRWE